MENYVVFNLEKLKVEFKGSYEYCIDFADCHDFEYEICPEEEV